MLKSWQQKGPPLSWLIFQVFSNISILLRPSTSFMGCTTGSFSFIPAFWYNLSFVGYNNGELCCPSCHFH